MHAVNPLRTWRTPRMSAHCSVTVKSKVFDNMNKWVKIPYLLTRTGSGLSLEVVGDYEQESNLTSWETIRTMHSVCWSVKFRCALVFWRNLIEPVTGTIMTWQLYFRPSKMLCQLYDNQQGNFIGAGKLISVGRPLPKIIVRYTNSIILATSFLMANHIIYRSVLLQCQSTIYSKLWPISLEYVIVIFKPSTLFVKHNLGGK